MRWWFYVSIPLPRVKDWSPLPAVVVGLTLVVFIMCVGLSHG